MTGIQRRAVTALYCIFGNAGPKYTQGNHEFLRRTLEGEPEPEHYQPTAECKTAFQKVMKGDYSSFPPRVRVKLEEFKAEQEHWRRVVGAAEGEEDG